MLKTAAVLGFNKFIRVIKTPYRIYRNESTVLYPSKTHVFREPTVLSSKKGVTSIVLVPCYHLIAFATEYGNIKVYSTESESKDPVSVFDKHNTKVTAIAHVEEKMIASVCVDGKLYIWDAVLARIRGSINFHEGQTLLSISKIDPSRLALGSYHKSFHSVGQARIIIVGHTKGENLNIKHVIDGYNHWIKTMVSASNLLVTAPGGQGPNIYTATKEKYATVWDANTYEHIIDLFYEGFMFSSIAINDEYIVVGANGLEVYKISGDFGYVTTLCKRKIFTKALFLNHELLLACTRSGRLDVISLNEKSSIYHLSPARGRRVIDFAVLKDGRIAIGTHSGMCALIDPPKQFKNIIVDSFKPYADSEFPEDARTIPQNEHT